MAAGGRYRRSGLDQGRRRRQARRTVRGGLDRDPIPHKKRKASIPEERLPAHAQLQSLIGAATRRTVRSGRGTRGPSTSTSSTNWIWRRRGGRGASSRLCPPPSRRLRSDRARKEECNKTCVRQSLQLLFLGAAHRTGEEPGLGLGVVIGTLRAGPGLRVDVDPTWFAGRCTSGASTSMTSRARAAPSSVATAERLHALRGGFFFRWQRRRGRLCPGTCRCRPTARRPLEQAAAATTTPASCS